MYGVVCILLGSAVCMCFDVVCVFYTVDHVVINHADGLFFSSSS